MKVLRRTAIALVLSTVALSPSAATTAQQATTPAEEPGKPLELPLRLSSLINHTGISVPDVTASALFYSKLFGGDKVARRNEIAWLSDGTRRLGFRALRAGETPGYDYQAFRIGKTNRSSLERSLVALGATIDKHESFDAPGTVRFTGPDGLHTVLVQDPR